MPKHHAAANAVAFGLHNAPVLAAGHVVAAVLSGNAHAGTNMSKGHVCKLTMHVCLWRLCSP